MTGLGGGFLQITGRLAGAAQGTINNVAAFAQKMDPTNQADVAKMQTMLAEMNVTLGLESAVVKSLEDALKSVIQRM